MENNGQFVNKSRLTNQLNRVLLFLVRSVSIFNVNWQDRDIYWTWKNTNKSFAEKSRYIPSNLLYELRQGKGEIW